MKFNASLISTWSRCGLQARFSYIDNRPRVQNAAASFGTCVHEALELYNLNGDLDEAIARFLHTWENPEVLRVEPDVWPKRMTYGGLRETGVQMIKEYHETASWSKREVIAAEHKFCVPFGEHLLSGVVDVLEYVPRKLKIVDLKTNSARPNYDSLYLNTQFTCYYYASLQPEFWMGFDDGTGKYPGFENGEELYERFTGVDRVPIWYHLRQNKEISCGRRDDLDFMRLYRCCEEIAHAIERDVYVPSISGDTCTMCSYTDVCKAFVPKQEEKKIASSDFRL